MPKYSAYPDYDFPYLSDMHIPGQKICMMAVLLTFPWCKLAGQDLWPLAKKAYTIALSESWIVSDEHYDDDGDIMPNFGENGYFATALNLRYGFSDRLTGHLMFPTYNYTYFRLPISDQKQMLWRAGDGEAGITYVIMQDSTFSWTGALHFGLPFGDNRGILPTGDGEYDQLLRLDVIDKTKLFNTNVWWGLYAGYNNRNDVYADEWHYGLEGGLRLDDGKLSISARLSGIQAIGDPEGATMLLPQSLFSNFREYLILSPEVRFQISSAFEIQLGFNSILAGRNVFSGTGYTIGISYSKT